MPARQLTPFRTASAKSQSETRLPFISVIVPIRNEAKYIDRLLAQLLRQDYDSTRFEIIVVDGHSTDHTRALVSRQAQRHRNLHLLDNPKRLSSAARNIAVQASVGEYVLLIDGHCEIDNSRYLHDLAEAFSRSGADSIGRPQPLDVPGARPLQRAIAAARASRLGHHPASFIYSSAEQFVPPQSVAIAYRRGVFDAIGMFDENFDACEDVDFNHRLDQAGFRCFFTPRVTVRYQPRSTLLGLFKQMTRYGRGRVRLFRKHRETFSLGSFVPAMFALAVLLSPLTMLMPAWLSVAWACGFAVYALAVLLNSFTIVARKRDVGLFPWLLFVFPVIHFGAGFGTLREYLRGRRQVPLSGSTEMISDSTRQRTPAGSARTG